MIEPKERYRLYTLAAGAGRGNQALIMLAAEPAISPVTRMELWANADGGGWELVGGYGWLALAHKLAELSRSDQVAALRIVDSATGSAIELHCATGAAMQSDASV